jgi:hypothetical protein
VKPEEDLGGMTKKHRENWVLAGVLQELKQLAEPEGPGDAKV